MKISAYACSCVDFLQSFPWQALFVILNGEFLVDIQSTKCHLFYCVEFLMKSHRIHPFLYAQLLSIEFMRNSTDFSDVHLYIKLFPSPLLFVISMT